MGLRIPDTFVPDAECNGCGSKWSHNLVPDTIYLLDITLACCIHDHEYIFGTTIADKYQADENFLFNLLVIIDGYDKWWYPHFLARHRAMTYYHAVVEAGDDSFWDGKIK